MKLNKIFGPSTLVAAAFIGPGTITTCTLAGVQEGYTLLWALLFSTGATMVLQEMASRLGFVTREGLGESIQKQFGSSSYKWFIYGLVISAILIGNAAYEAGNISGGVLGLQLLFGEFTFWPLILGIAGIALLYFGKYKNFENLLIGLVILMSICFIITAIMVKPDVGALFKGFNPFNFAEWNLLLILGLIGTTVVPYNLFLHASTISKKWPETASLKDIRTENNFSILLGGIISMLIIITAAASRGSVTEVSNAKDLAIQLQPLFGDSATIFMGLGLLAAGFSSAITAPIAAAYAAKGIFSFRDESDMRFRLIWFIIIVIGIVVSLSGIKPIPIIKFAQIANALLLPFIASYLFYLCNRKNILGEHVNSFWSNLLGGGVILVATILSLRTFYLLFS